MTNPHRISRRIESIRDAAGAVLRRDLRHHGYPYAVFPPVAEIGRDRRVLDRNHFSGSFGGTADRARDGNAPRLCGDRYAILAAGGAVRLCRNLLSVDPDGAADGRLCAGWR